MNNDEGEGAWRAKLLPFLRSIPYLATTYRAASRLAGRARLAFSDPPFWSLEPEQMVRLAYNVLVRRDPDDYIRTYHLERLRDGRETPSELVDSIRGSDEYRSRTPFRPSSLVHSLHFSRSEFVIGLPPARHILDLGGSHRRDPRGALVLLGYPYPFELLTIVDLPPEDRHPLYQSDRYATVDTPKGKVCYEFRSMVDLSFADDATIDLVYSGQSIEHVTPADADIVMSEVYRVLRPGGYFALDTPNAALTRLQQSHFIDPDHRHEYRLEELIDKAGAAGFKLHSARGLNYAGTSLDRGVFDLYEVAANAGVFFEAEACYLLAVLFQKTF